MSLPVRNIQISESAMEELERNIWSERYVKAKMLANGRMASIFIRFRGGHTRTYPKRSYEVVRKDQTFHYNAEFDDPSMIRNALSFSLFPLIGVPAPRTKHVLLKINDHPLGVYLEIEGVEKMFFRRRRIGVSSLFYAVNNHADFGLVNPDTDLRKSDPLMGYEYKMGPVPEKEKEKLRSFINGLNTHTGERARLFIQSRVDVSNYLHWLAGAVFTGNYDGFVQNYAIYRSRKTKKWRMIPWDYEGTWGRNCYGKLVESDQVAVTGYNNLTQKILEDPALRRRYKSIMLKALKGPFTEKNLMLKVQRMTKQIAPYIREDSSRRWSYSDFLGEPAIIRRYVRERRKLLIKEINRL